MRWDISFHNMQHIYKVLYPVCGPLPACYVYLFSKLTSLSSVSASPSLTHFLTSSMDTTVQVSIVWPFSVISTVNRAVFATKKTFSLFFIHSAGYCHKNIPICYPPSTNFHKRISTSILCTVHIALYLRFKFSFTHSPKSKR